MNNDLLYQVALTLVPHIGDVHTKTLIHYYGNAEAVFRASKKELEQIEGIGHIRAGSIKAFSDFSIPEKEIRFIEQHHITPLFMTDQAYPKRLLNCYDSPALLYYKGNADLNAVKVVAVIGTRSHSEYGQRVCEELIADLQTYQVVIVSGLAFGIDTIAHKAALKNNLPTIGVLAHGLDRLYPASNTSLARQMTMKGGLLTDFISGTRPDKQNFPLRNRIVAGISDAVIIMETGKRGGSLITAELANSYHKDVFAVPGRITDHKSEGCHYLIKHHKASLITSAADLVENMNWHEQNKPVTKKKNTLFVELTDDEKNIAGILQQQGSIHIDELYFRSGLSSSAIANALLTLEMQSLIISMPGKIYKMA